MNGISVLCAVVVVTIGLMVLKENIENVLRYPGVLFGELIMSHVTSEPHHRSPLCLSIQLESFSLFILQIKIYAKPGEMEDIHLILPFLS